MRIGVPKEIKIQEGRVAMTPAGVDALKSHGHDIYVESGAGLDSGISDSAFEKAGAVLVPDPDLLWSSCDMIVKVKEPVDAEFGRMRKGQILFAYLHLAASEKLTKELLDRGVIGIAYETVQLEDGSLPLLAPMSAVAGRLSIQMGCACLEAKNGGKGILLSGVPGVRPARVAILGAGISGLNAAHLAVGMGALVTILDINQKKLDYIEDIFHARIITLMSDPHNIVESVRDADLVIGSVLIPGARTPHLITRELISEMEPGSAFVDIAIDQGGCAETSRPTTHDNPTYREEGIVHYCVTNMPGAVPRTSTCALTNATFPYVLEIADKGWERALHEDRALAKGLNVYEGVLTNRKVADAFGWKYRDFEVA
ncbi:MAG TPA: alanine dehydrogenase [Deltaproteobacteria bacterium]|jgi:alanine dehydrogenase|nr:alanine dehydrogenase [Deltaproteobacteria bacterium]HQH99861.1 alanine dehydrogenase [Deltaproteobacteria bacterium]HQJ08969.1 alanine dehydrogenase [Deltaproteobacteria bacterium]